MKQSDFIIQRDTLAMKRESPARFFVRLVSQLFNAAMEPGYHLLLSLVPHAEGTGVKST